MFHISFQPHRIELERSAPDCAVASDRGYCEDGQTEAAEGGGEDGRGQVKVAKPVMTSSTRFTVEQ